jgi:hypothetical protein
MTTRTGRYKFGIAACTALALGIPACSSQEPSPVAPTAPSGASAALHTPVPCDHDTVAPTIAGARATPNTLWPPNHKWWTVRVSYTLSDNCSAVSSRLTVVSNEPVNGLGDGNTAPDWEVLDARTVRLRAERSGTGSGRVYTITIHATDVAGNTARQTVRVTVAHDQRK